jgi:uncharacterized caspase-like protein
MNHKTWTNALTCLCVLAPSLACALPEESNMATASAPPVATAPAPAPSDAAPRRRALLVGINDYSASDLSAPKPAADAGPLPKGQRGDWPDLAGAVNDVEAMRDMLVGRFEFQDADVHLLKDQEATRDAILRAIREHLVEPVQKGDVVVFHYSGHGSQVRNSKSPERDQLDESIVPADSIRGAFDVRDKELRGLFNEALAKGARPVVVLDSCHSGSGVRGLLDGSQSRVLQPDLRDVADGKDYGPPIEDCGALVLAAAQDDEPALESTDESNRRHGAFTLALLRALRAASPGESSRYVFERAQGWLATSRYQRPVLEGLPERRAEPLFGAPSEGQGGAVVAVEGVGGDGQVWLRGGWIDGLAPGSELRRFGAESSAGPRLRVTELDGRLRSRAEVLAENGADSEVKRGDLFEVDTWVADLQSLRVWVPCAETTDAARSLAEKLAASARDGKLGWVEDPTETTPSHVVRWSGGAFELLEPGRPPTILGERPSVDDVLSHLPDDAQLFVQLPAPAALPGQLEIGPGSRYSAVEVVDDPGQATYVLAGRLRDALNNPTLEYAWIRPGSRQGDRESVHLPERSAWIALASSPSGDLKETSWKLRDKVLRLYKVFAWSLLEPGPGARAAFPYRLAIADAGGALVDELVSGRDYTLVLHTEDGAPVDAASVQNRYVYVFAIDSAGASTLLYPQISRSSENKYPGVSVKDGSAPGRIDLGADSRFEVVEPFGFDTFYLFSSADPISDPGLAFQYEGVRGREPPRRSALATLLAEVGSTKRGSRGRATSSSWSIDKKTYPTKRAED